MLHYNQVIENHKERVKGEIMESYEVFRRLMYEKNVIVADVIRGSGVTRQTLLTWKKGKEPQLRTLRKIAEYFGVPVTEFIKE